MTILIHPNTFWTSQLLGEFTCFPRRAISLCFIIPPSIPSPAILLKSRIAKLFVLGGKCCHCFTFKPSLSLSCVFKTFPIHNHTCFHLVSKNTKINLFRRGKCNFYQLKVVLLIHCKVSLGNQVHYGLSGFWYSSRETRGASTFLCLKFTAR